MIRLLFNFISILFFAVDGPRQPTEKPLCTLPDEIRPPEVVISPDQNRFAWITRDERAIFVVVDGKKHAGYDWIVQGAVAFTADSKHAVYAARKRNKALMVIDGRDGDFFDSVDHWLTSQRGSEVGFSITHNGRAHAILGKTIGAPFDFVRWHALAGD